MTSQVELRWKTHERLNPRLFRARFGDRLRALVSFPNAWSWLFNERSNDIATVRFYTRVTDHGAEAGIIAVGEEACGRIQTVVPMLFKAAEDMGLPAIPEIVYNRVSAEPANFALPYRVNTLVVAGVKQEVHGRWDDLRADISPLKPLVHHILMRDLYRHAEQLDIAMPAMSAEDLVITGLGKLGSQPMETNDRTVTLPRLTHVTFKMPIKLSGDWRAGRLATYGNGKIFFDRFGEPPAYPVLEGTLKANVQGGRA